MRQTRSAIFVFPLFCFPFCHLYFCGLYNVQCTCTQQCKVVKFIFFKGRKKQLIRKKSSCVYKCDGTEINIANKVITIFSFRILSTYFQHDKRRKTHMFFCACTAIPVENVAAGPTGPGRGHAGWPIPLIINIKNRSYTYIQCTFTYLTKMTTINIKSKKKLKKYKLTLIYYKIFNMILKNSIK